MHLSEGPCQFRVVQVELDAAELGQFADLPGYDARDAPGLSVELDRLAAGQVTGEGVKQNVGVEIEHPT